MGEGYVQKLRGPKIYNLFKCFDLMMVVVIEFVSAVDLLNSITRVPTCSKYQGSLGPPFCQNGGSFPKLRGPKI